MAMLEFIVLGLVPGTHIQITFAWILAFVVLCGAAYELLHYVKPRYAQANSTKNTNLAQLATDDIAL